MLGRDFGGDSRIFVDIHEKPWHLQAPRKIHGSASTFMELIAWFYGWGFSLRSYLNKSSHWQVFYSVASTGDGFVAQENMHKVPKCLSWRKHAITCSIQDTSFVKGKLTKTSFIKQNVCRTGVNTSTLCLKLLIWLPFEVPWIRFSPLLSDDNESWKVNSASLSSMKIARTHPLTGKPTWFQVPRCPMLVLVLMFFLFVERIFPGTLHYKPIWVVFPWWNGWHRKIFFEVRRRASQAIAENGNFVAEKGIAIEVPFSVRSVSYTCCRTCLLLVTQFNNTNARDTDLGAKMSSCWFSYSWCFKKASKASTIANLQHGCKVVAHFHSNAWTNHLGQTRGVPSFNNNVWKL